MTYQSEMTGIGFDIMRTRGVCCVGCMQNNDNLTIILSCFDCNIFDTYCKQTSVRGIPVEHIMIDTIKTKKINVYGNNV